MFRGKKVLAVIPARGGSKRLSNKNIRYLGNKPLIAWSIQAGLDAELIDKDVVSTEDPEISSIAIEWGAHEVINRSEHLSTDHATTNDVIIEVLDKLQADGEFYEYLVLLQPTSTLRTGVHIKCAFDLIEGKSATGAVSVCRTEHPVEWMGKISRDQLLDSFIRNAELEKSSQDFLPSFQINGAIYIANVRRFLEEKTVFLRLGMVAYVMDRRSSVDIDDEYDFQLASWLLTLKKTNRVVN